MINLYVISIKSSNCVSLRKRLISLTKSSAFICDDCDYLASFDPTFPGDSDGGVH